MIASSSGERNPMDTTLISPAPTGLVMGSIRGRSPVAGLAGFEAPFHAEHPRHREAGDVGVEQARP